MIRPQQGRQKPTCSGKVQVHKCSFIEGPTARTRAARRGLGGAQGPTLAAVGHGHTGSHLRGRPWLTGTAGAGGGSIRGRKAPEHPVGGGPAPGSWQVAPASPVASPQRPPGPRPGVAGRGRWPARVPSPLPAPAAPRPACASHPRAVHLLQPPGAFSPKGRQTLHSKEFSSHFGLRTPGRDVALTCELLNQVVLAQKQRFSSGVAIFTSDFCC